MSKDYRSANEAYCRSASANEWASWREGEEGWGFDPEFDFPDDLDDTADCNVDSENSDSDV